jgi:O-acetylhomoserine/O-acetylserine sulfhydrylase-like pyridoxal-dependent enzyme
VTKYIAGHSDVVAGAVCGSTSFIERLWHTRKLFGSCLSPHDAYLVGRGIKTIHLRVARQNASAGRLAQFLAAHADVARVHYPGLATHPQHTLAATQMSGGFGGMLAFEVRGGLDGARRCVEALRLATLAVSLGGCETLVVTWHFRRRAPVCRPRVVDCVWFIRIGSCCNNNTCTVDGSATSTCRCWRHIDSSFGRIGRGRRSDRRFSTSIGANLKKQQ